MPFGLRNASQTFQRLIDLTLADMSFAAGYIDDVIVGSSDISSHFGHLEKLFARLRSFGLRLKMPKCTSFKKSVPFLGFTISAAGVEPLRSKIDPIDEYPTPENEYQVRRFLGMTGFYHRFIRNFSGIAAPLSDDEKNVRKISMD
jgi:hypothetical protein